jgi:hypothetical protein
VPSARTEREATPRLQRAIANLVAWRFATGLVALGAVLLYVAARVEGTAEALLQELGAVLIVAGALTVMWDVYGRRAFTAEVLEAANVSSDVRTAKLVQLTDNYHAVAWDDHLARARQVDLFFAYAGTWRMTHDDALQRLMARHGSRTRVVLPNAANERLIVPLADKFELTPDVLRERIARAESEFSDLRGSLHASSTLEIRFSDEFPVFTYYRFDAVAVTVMYAQAKGRTPTPTYVYEQGGMLFEFFDRQFERLWTSASLPAEGAAGT